MEGLRFGLTMDGWKLRTASGLERRRNICWKMRESDDRRARREKNGRSFFLFLIKWNVYVCS